jgi:hypothetical protein
MPEIRLDGPAEPEPVGGAVWFFFQHLHYLKYTVWKKRPDPKQFFVQAICIQVIFYRSFLQVIFYRSFFTGHFYFYTGHFYFYTGHLYFYTDHFCKVVLYTVYFILYYYLPVRCFFYMVIFMQTTNFADSKYVLQRSAKP